MKLKIVKGTRDLYDDAIVPFLYLEKKARHIFELYGYSEIRTPIFERTDLFAHGVGQDTDIVGKEMFLLEDRRGRSLALRPEATASVVRSVITGNMMKQNNQKRLFYMGPMFRYEQPQKGRFRQFFQIGAELFGVATPDADLELLLMLRHYFKSIQLDNVSFQLNTIGCHKSDCRPAFKEKLVTYLKENQDAFCENCQQRIESNPLRVLDCKNESCIALTENAPRIYEHVCDDCRDHFNELESLLELHQVEYTKNFRLVRGLDYYSGTVFEVYSDNLGAQNAVGGGGRYDRLFELYGAKSIPAFGFALGLDRLALLTKPVLPDKKVAFVICNDRAKATEIVAKCREAEWVCHYDPFQSSMKSQFRQANKSSANLVLVLGEDELKTGQISVKNMQTGEQVSIKQEEVSAYLQK